MEKSDMRIFLLMLLTAFTLAGCTWYYLFSAAANELFQDETQQSIFEREHCMAEAIYFEAGNQPLVGKIAVAAVILNRVYSMDYPDSICEVVHQGPVRESWKKNGVFYPIKNKCQFSYYCDGRSDIPKFGPTWEDCLMVAEWALQDEWFIDQVEGATHYHASYVHPNWADYMQRVVQIQDHVFYK